MSTPITAIKIERGLQRRKEDSDSACSCSFCNQDGIRLAHTDPPELGTDQEDCGVWDDQNQEDEARDGQVSKKQKQQYQKFRGCFNIGDMFRNNRICFNSFLDFVRPLDPRQRQNQTSNKSNDDTRDDTPISNKFDVPSVIKIEAKYLLHRRKDRKGNSPSVISERKQMILHKTENLKSMLERDLKTRATATAGQDEHVGNEYLIIRTVSSISCPSFTDVVTSCSFDYLDLSRYDDPLKKVLDFNEDYRDESKIEERDDVNHSGETEKVKNCILHESHSIDSKNANDDDGNEDISLALSGLSKREECDTLGIHGQIDSFLSYEDVFMTSLGINDGISYDDASDVSTISNMKLQVSDDEKADLNDLCAESVQSGSIMSF